MKQVVNLPTERIRKLLEIIEDMYGIMAEMTEIVASSAPELLEKFPSAPLYRELEAEKAYQRLAGNYNQRKREAMRLLRIRKAGGERVRTRAYGSRSVEEAAADTRGRSKTIDKTMIQDGVILKKGETPEPKPTALEELKMMGTNYTLDPETEAKIIAEAERALERKAELERLGRKEID